MSRKSSGGPRGLPVDSGTEGSPTCSKSALMALFFSMNAIILRRPPQGHRRFSVPNTRLSADAQSSR